MSYQEAEVIIAPEVIEIEVATDGPQGPVGPTGGTSNRELLAIATSNQTVFSLTAIPVQPHLSQLYLNGAKAQYGTDYSINSSTLTWLSAIALAPTDEFEIYY